MAVRSTVITTMVAVAACGRVGFENHTGAMAGSEEDVLVDADLLDAVVAANDAAMTPHDGSIPPDGLAICMRPPPFLRFITVVPSNNGSVQTAVYCYSGIPGPLDATIRRDGSGSSEFAQVTVPIAAGMAAFVIGNTSCFNCFVRLEANGFEDEGPMTDFIGG